MIQVQVKFKRMRGCDFPLPSRATKGSVGFDLQAYLPEQKEIFLRPYQRQLIYTGFAIELPENCFAMVVPRSGWAFKRGLTVLNSPGIIDTDYRGEIGVILINLSSLGYTIKHGDRIAQLVIVPVPYVTAIEVVELEETERLDKGFGSTGV